LCIFSEIGKHGGGTLVVEGSHKVVARYLASKKEGVASQEGIDECSLQHPWLAALTGQTDDSFLPGSNRVEKFIDRPYTDEHGTRLKVIETISSPGDVILCHPFLYHTPSQNHSGATRFMCNRTTPLKERMNFDRADGSDYSPLELSIKRAIQQS
jgi:ectoine hydroxylase-related dioxygenase (phytanoyl-CoA dioxygenase family)